MRVLVIGGSRFIGPRFVHRLAAAGHEVAVFHRGQTTAALPPAIRILLGDRHRLADYAGEFRRFGPDLVVDMIPFTEEDALSVVETALAVTNRAAAGRVYNVAEPTAHTEAEWVARIGAIVGWGGEIIAVPDDKMPAPFNTAQDLSVDTTRIRSELGYREVVEQMDITGKPMKGWIMVEPDGVADDGAVAGTVATGEFARSSRQWLVVTPPGRGGRHGVPILPHQPGKVLLVCSTLDYSSRETLRRERRRAFFALPAQICG